jgi:hypothetical protein
MGTPLTRKSSPRKWARGNGPGPAVVVIGPGQGGYGLRGLGDGVARGMAQQRFELPDVVLIFLS